MWKGMDLKFLQNKDTFFNYFVEYVPLTSPISMNVSFSSLNVLCLSQIRDLKLYYGVVIFQFLASSIYPG